MGKALLYIATARKFSLFWDWVNRVNFVDKLIVRNYMHHQAHEIAMKYFFKHGYDYFIVLCDDVLASPDHVRLLLDDEEQHHFPIISGWHNRDLKTNNASITMKPIDSKALTTKVISTSSYHFVPIKDIVKAKYGYPFITVWYVGLPFTLIRRETLKKIPLRPFRLTRDRLCVTPKTKKHGRGHCFDVQFAIDCAAHKIPILVDQRVFLLHFKPYAGNFWVGKKPSVQFVKAEV